MTIIVDDTNRAPTLHVSSHTAVLGETLAFAVAADDADAGTTLVYSVRGLPELASFDAATGDFEWTPGPGQDGVYTLIFEVSDGQATAKPWPCHGRAMAEPWPGHGAEPWPDNLSPL